MLKPFEETPPEPDDPRLVPHAYRSKDKLAIVAPTWEISNKFEYSDFVEAWKENNNVAMRDFASIGSQSIESYFKNPELLKRRATPMTYMPFGRAVGYNDGDFELRNDFKVKNKHYYIHLDLAARRDACGIAMAHYDPDHEKEFAGYGVRKGMIVLDFVLQVIAKQGQDIDFSLIRKRIIFPLAKLGFYIAKVTMDQYNSVEMIRELEREGITGELYSIDRSTEAYDTFLELMLMCAVDYPNHPVMMRELQQLEQIDGKKIDHPKGKGKSKDCSDAAVGAVFHAKLNAGFEPHMISQSISREQVAAVVSPQNPESLADIRKREQILGFSEIPQVTLW